MTSNTLTLGEKRTGRANMEHKIVLVILVVIGAASAEIAKMSTCSDVNQDVCTVNQLRITPCRSTKNCILKKLHNTSMSFDFTPNFEATKLKTAVYWDETGAIFAELGLADGCRFTKCPVTSGTQQTFDYSLYISKLLPEGTYLFKWVLYNEENKDQICCFKTTIKIRK